MKFQWVKEHNILTVIFINIIFLSACLPSETAPLSTENAEIVKVNIGDNEFYIPKVYFNRMGAVLDTSILLTAMTPDFSPVLEDPQELWEQGEWYKNVDALVSYVKQPLGNNGLTEQSIQHFKAFEIVGKEYGLIHQKQSEGYVQDHRDVWLEKGSDGYLSVVACMEKLMKTDFPQCTHRMYWNELSIRLSYDKRLLPHWKEIKENTLALLESFESEETAQFFLTKRLKKQ